MADSSTSVRQPTHPQSQPHPPWLRHLPALSLPPPPPPPPPPPHYCHNTSPFLLAFAAGMAFILFIVVIIYAIEYLIFQPLLPEFRVDTLQLANFSTAAAPFLSASWVVGFSVNNPNKKLAISFDNTESAIYYKDEIISQARIHRFAVRRRNLTAVVTPFFADSAVDVSVLSDINGDFARGAINFTMVVLGRVAFETGAWRWRRSFFRVFCNDLSVGISSPPSPGGGSGQLVGGSKPCQVG